METLKIEAFNTTPLLINGSNGEELLRIEYNGDFFVKGELVENNQQIVDAFTIFLKQQGLLK
jgi:hypothetical protein